MLLWWGLRLLLLMQEVFDDLSSGHFLGHGLVRLLWCRELILNPELGTVFIEAFLNDLHRQCLMNSNATGTALMSTSVWCPAVRWSCPGFAAHCNELLLVLFCLLALVPGCSLSL